MSYDFRDLAAFHGVMVFCEQRQGNLMPTDFELISEARKLADDLGTEVIGLLLGSECGQMVHDLAGYATGISQQLFELYQNRALSMGITLYPFR